MKIPEWLDPGWEAPEAVMDAFHVQAALGSSARIRTTLWLLAGGFALFWPVDVFFGGDGLVASVVGEGRLVQVVLAATTAALVARLRLLAEHPTATSATCAALLLAARAATLPANATGDVLWDMSGLLLPFGSVVLLAHASVRVAWILGTAACWLVLGFASRTDPWVATFPTHLLAITPAALFALAVGHAGYVDTLRRYLATQAVHARADALDVELDAKTRALRRLATHVDTLHDAERKRLARELHDETSQCLAALKIGLKVVRDRQDQGLPLRENLDDLDAIIDTIVADLRRILSNLRPTVLDDLGVVAAIDSLTRRFEDQTSIRCSVLLDPPGLELDDRRSVAVFRVLQECLTNVARHSGARHVDIELALVDGDVRLRVTDDGVGLRGRHLDGQAGLGILGMRERAIAVGGTLELRDVEGGGAEVALFVPKAAVAADNEPSVPLARAPSAIPPRSAGT